MTATFHDMLTAFLPKLRAQALGLTRNHAAADDLVQDAVSNALAGAASFTHGSNFPAWMSRILRNRFISDLRKRRNMTSIDDVPDYAFATTPCQDHHLILADLGTALARLPAEQREALMMVVVHGLNYEELAEKTACAVGTAKSRVFRARRRLSKHVLGEVTRSKPVRCGPRPVLDMVGRRAPTPAHQAL